VDFEQIMDLPNYIGAKGLSSGNEYKPGYDILNTYRRQLMIEVTKLLFSVN
jgi:hypothetical protein